MAQSGETAVDPGLLHDVPWDDPRALARHRQALLANHPEQALAIARMLDLTDADETAPARFARAS